MFLALRELKQSKLRNGLIGSLCCYYHFLVLFISGLANGYHYDNASSIKIWRQNKFVFSR